MRTVLLCLFLSLLCLPANADSIEIAQLDGFVHDSTGLVDVLDSSSAGYFSNLDANNTGSFGWTFTNNGSTTLTSVLFFAFLDADLDRSINTSFNEYGQVTSQSLPPGSAANAVLWSMFQIDEPGFVSGTIFNNLLAGSLDNTNHVPLGMTDDVSLALGFLLGDVAPGQQFTGRFQISRSNIGGLSQVDPDSNNAFYFNGFVTAPAFGPNDTGNGTGSVSEPATLPMVCCSLACFAALCFRRRRQRNAITLLTLLVVCALYPSVGAAATIVYPDFSSTAGLTLNGTASVATSSDGKVLRIVPAAGFVNGSFFSATPISAGTFSTYFQFRFTQGGGLNGGADGIVFVVQPVSSGIGGVGGELGYSGVTPSVGVEFDIFQNPWDTNNHHVAVLKNGDVTIHMAQYDTPAPMLDGNIRHVWIDYDGSTLQVRMNDTNVRPQDPIISYSINIPGIIQQSNAFVGFTAGTGGGYANHDILTWQYNSEFSPIGLSSPVITNLTARFKDASVDLAWTAPIVQTGVKIASYNLYRRTEAQAPLKIRSELAATNFTDTGLANGTTYYYTVRWVDANGVESGDSTEMSATPTSTPNRGARNTPPTILSNPVVLATVGTSYSYPVRASDPDPGDVLSYSLPLAAAGMTIVPSSGAVLWTPTGVQAGDVPVKVRAQDRNGNFATQQYVITVQSAAPTTPPSITSTPQLSATVGQIYFYQVTAIDPSSSAILSYSLTNAPPGMSIFAGLVQWVPTAAQVGSNLVTVKAQDQFGLSTIQSFAVTASPAPILSPTITSTPITSATATVPYAYQVTATGQSLAYAISAAPIGMTIDAVTGLIEWTPAPNQQGAQSVTVRVQNQQGGSVSQLFGIQVGPPVLPPTVTITSPAPNAIITQVTNIIGSIVDPNGGAAGPMTWKLGILKPGASTYQTIAAGEGAVSNGIITTIDPTLLPNNTYPIRFTVNLGPFTRDIDLLYDVVGNLKLGNSSIQFTDLSIPVAGIPITITRRYDSLDTSQGDFGAAWRLALPGQIADSALGQAYTGLTRVYVTRPDGKRVGFKFSPTYSGGFLPVWFPAFQADPGVTDTLSVATTSLFNSNGAFFEFTPYNPKLFTFTTKEGVKYDIDKVAGLQKITDASGNTLTVTPGGLVSSTGVALAFTRDLQGRIAQITEPGPTPGTLQYGYDSNGNLTSFKDQLGNQTVYSYENASFPNYLTKIADPLGRPLTRNIYNAAGQIIAQCDANGDPVTLSGCAKFDPNATGRLQTIVNARGFKTDLLLDDRGNVLTERHWLDGSVFLDTVRTYDANNNLLTQTDPANNKTTYTYDAADNKLTETDPLNHVTTYTYNTCNKVLTQKDATGSVTTYSYDALNCNLLRFVTDALNGMTEYRYNAAGQQTEFIDAVGSHWVWTHSSAGFVQSLTDPLGKATTCTFGPTGDLLTRVDRNSRRIDFRYDGGHHLTTETWDTTPARVTSYAYNAAGQLTSAVDPDSALALAYFNTGNLLGVDNNNTPGVPRVAMTYGYDSNGNVTSVADSRGGATSYGYDGLDRLSQITQGGTGVNQKRVDYQYDNASFLTKISRFSDSAGIQPVTNTLIDTDCDGCPGRITTIRHRSSTDNTVLHDLTYTRDLRGNVVASTDAEGAHVYTYDKLGQLLTATHSQPALQPNEFYSYDTAGNRLASHLSATYSYGYMQGKADSRLILDQRFSYRYDDEGNQVVKTDLASGTSVTFAYDYHDRLTYVEERSLTGTLVEASSYRYDALGRRISAIEAGNARNFVFDGLNPMLEFDDKSVIVSRRLYSRRPDSVIADEANGVSRWFLRDSLGTVRDLVVASSTPAIADHYVYDSFGSVLSQSGVANQTDLLFTARESTRRQDSYFRSRFYNSTIGRFNSEDPVGLDRRDSNVYVYAQNNPLSFVDPLGTDSATVEAFFASTVGRVLTRLVISEIVVGVVETNCDPAPTLGKAAEKGAIVAATLLTKPYLTVAYILEKINKECLETALDLHFINNAQ